jgi:hypothetical protein
MALDHHSLVERRDAIAARVLEGKGKQRMQETRDGTEQHANGEPARGTQVLQVGLADRSRVRCKETPYSHDVSLGKSA